jgi:hypothetical protein
MPRLADYRYLHWSSYDYSHGDYPSLLFIRTSGTLIVIVTDSLQETLKTSLGKIQFFVTALAHTLLSVYTVAMQTKRNVVQFDTGRNIEGEDLAPGEGAKIRQKLLLFILLMLMLSALLFLDAVLPLAGFWFHTALLTQTGSWALLPTHIFFPGWAVTSSVSSLTPTPPPIALSWLQIPLLITAMLFVFLVYVFALHLVPLSLISYRSILYTTLLLGLLCILIPVVTSPDIYSYISYARMGVIYHLNPLTTLPTAINNDPTFVHLYWSSQPSAYGPTWVAITSLLQWLMLPFGRQSLLPMVLALRFSGLLAHVCSTLLIWSIAGQIQQRYGLVSARKRIVATLAFAWNPLLLFEACVNAHNDAVLLLLILLAIWFLLPVTRKLRGNILATLMLVLATCLKLNVALLLPFFLIFIWKQENQENVPLRTPFARTLSMALIYAGSIILLYAPFWQNGKILDVFQANPTASRAINTLPEFLGHLYNSLMGAIGHLPVPVNGSPAENVTHALSIAIFVMLYALLCWQAIVRTQAMKTLPSLMRWLALAWLLYCVFGTPWFWPWYSVTLFGLYALVDATSEVDTLLFGIVRLPLAIYLFAFSMLSIYSFYAWGPHVSYIPGLPGFQWAFLRGLWVWIIPLLALRWPLKLVLRQRYRGKSIASEVA